MSDIEFMRSIGLSDAQIRQATTPSVVPAPPVVPASTKIRFTRVRHIDTDRLERRAAWLRTHGPRLAREADARSEVRHIARELLTIEAELARRAS